MLATADDGTTTSSTPGRARSRPAASGCARRPATVKPVAELIRFVVAPDGAVVPDLKRRLPGRGIWITATRPALQQRARPQGVRPQLQARGPGRRRISSNRPSGCSSAPRSMRSPWPTRPGRSSIGLRQGRGRARPGGTDRRPDPRLRRRPGRRAQAQRRAAASAPKRGQHRDHRRIYIGAIGFGIGAVKCDTCSPACRSRKRDISGARCAPRALPDRRPCRLAMP